MKQAIYAGSFDPWTFGHQFVLESAMAVFDRVHIVSAINLAKQTAFSPDIRARVIAHAIDPFCDWWSQQAPFHIGKGVLVTAQEGLIADYARMHNILHLIRGLRSTTDFEAEFNLYFANQAIGADLQTWAIMCPPRLLHCSSTYVKTVVGNANVSFVGTHFISQALMLNWHKIIGQIFDLIFACSKYRFAVNSINLQRSDLAECMQLLFSSIFQKKLDINKEKIMQTNAFLTKFLQDYGNRLRSAVLIDRAFPQEHVDKLWSFLAFCIGQNKSSHNSDGIDILLSCAPNLAKTAIKLFDRENITLCK